MKIKRCEVLLSDLTGKMLLFFWDKTKPQNDWVWSYGISARTNLAGYPIRFDMAWPGAFNKQPVWYLSLNCK